MRTALPQKRVSRQDFRSCGALLLLSLCLLMPGRSDARECQIGAGRPGGGMYGIAETLKQRLVSNGASVRLRIVTSDGSCQNIESLLKGQVAFALLQYDIASEAVIAGSPEAANDLQKHLMEYLEQPTSPVHLLGSWPCLDQTTRSDCLPEQCWGHFGPVDLWKPSLCSSEQILFQQERLVDLSTWIQEQDLPRSLWMCGISPWLASQASLNVVAGVGDESVHLLVRSPLMIEDFSTLGNYRIFFGSPLSGSYETARTILGAAGLVASDVAFSGTWKEALQEIGNPGSNLLAIIRTISPGDQEVARLIREGLVSIQSLPDDTVRRLIEAHPYFRPCEIPKGTYPGMGPRTIQTICVDTVLVTNTAHLEAPMDQEVEEVLQALERRDPTDTSGASSSSIRLKWRNFGDEDRMDLHPAASLRLRQELVRAWGRPSLLLVSVALFLMAVWLIRKRLKKSRHPLPRNMRNQFENPAWPIVSVLALMWISAFTVQQIEQPINPAIQKVMDAFWSMASFATGNFESDRLRSPWSRFIGILTTLGGLGILAWFTASLTALFTTGRALWRKRYAGHVIVINAHDALFRLVEVLRSPGPLRLPIVHIVAKNLPVRLRNRLLRIRGVVLHDLDAEVTADLRLLCPATSRRVIVLGERTEIDGKPAGRGFHPLRVVRAIRLASAPGAESDARQAIMQEGGRTRAGSEETHRSRGSRRPWTVIDSDTENANDLLIPNTDWLVSAPTRLLLEHLLARAAFDPSFSTMISHLLSYQDCNAEIWTALLPRSSASRTWRALREGLVRGNRRSGVVPIGIFRPSESSDCLPAGTESVGDVRDWLLQSPCSPLPGKVLLNPPPGFLLENGDSLIALAEDEQTLLDALDGAFPRGRVRNPRSG